jgi:hypothetical protein
MSQVIGIMVTGAALKDGHYEVYRSLRPDLTDYGSAESYEFVWNTGNTRLGAYPVIVAEDSLAKLAAGQKVELKIGDLRHANDEEVIW